MESELSMSEKSIKHLNEKQNRFLKGRRKLNRLWPWAGAIMPVMLLLLVVFLLIKSPLLINPYAVADQIKAGVLKASSMKLLALLCPVMTGMTICMVFIIIVYMWGLYFIEKKYHMFIDRLAEKCETEHQEHTGKEKE